MRRALSRRTPFFLAVLVVAAAQADLARAGWDAGAVICTDYSGPGAISSLQRQSPWGIVPDLASVGHDPVARWHDGLLYVVNRAGDGNVQVIDPADGWRTVRQFSVGSHRNPQDIAFAPDGAAYVSCYGEAVLLRLDPVTGAILATISTASFADADGLPETAWMEAVESRLFITAQRLDAKNWFTPTGPGLLLVYDMAAGDWIDVDPARPGVDAIVLNGANPSGQPELVPGGARLRLGCVGWYGLDDGGVEVVDLQNLCSLGFAVTEAALGGDLMDFVVTPFGRAYAIVCDAQFRTAVKAWDPRDGTLLGTIRSATTYAHADLAWDGAAWLYLADRTAAAAGVRVFDAVTGGEMTVDAIPTGLPPAWIVLPRDPLVTGVPLDAPAFVLEGPWPNPANPGCEFLLRGPAGAVVPLTVRDLRGRRVRSGLITLGSDGRGRYRFDGRDDAGRPVASGRYLLTAGAGGAAAAGLTIVR